MCVCVCVCMCVCMYVCMIHTVPLHGTVLCSVMHGLFPIPSLPYSSIILCACVRVCVCVCVCVCVKGSNMSSASELFSGTIGKLGEMLTSSSSSHMYYLMLFVVCVFLLIYFMMGR